ncbi:MAG TPA: metallophosphatase, partial [Polyangiaceae bacterium]|nr:metallophosphatase [Polyangiaceae bacterium]
MGASVGLVACGGQVPVARAGAGNLLLLHTSDLHSHVFPSQFVAGELDSARGLGVAGESLSAGGLARLGTLLARERLAAPDSLYLDSGDLWQGTLVHELFEGEAELVGVAALRLDAQVVGNHDLDAGLEPLVARYGKLAAFPLLAANYVSLEPEDEPEALLRPWAVLQAGELRVGVIGVGNVDSVQALENGTDQLGLEAELASVAVQSSIELLRPQCDVIVALTHLGVDRDRELVRRTSGLDLVLGGHQHVALDEPVVERDCSVSDEAGPGYVLSRFGERVPCIPRDVLIAHSGAHGHYLGRMALSLSRSDDEGLEVVGHDFKLLPVGPELPEDPAVAQALSSYRETFDRVLSSAPPIAFAPLALARETDEGGNSELGDLVADAALAAAPADLALVPSSSLRSDLQPGLIDESSLYQALPFPDPLVRSYLTGRALELLFARIAERARQWGCRTPVQVAGAALRFDCAAATARLFVGVTSSACSTDLECLSLGGVCGLKRGLRRCLTPAEPDTLYALTTSRYLLDSDEGADGYGEVVADTLRAAVEGWLRGLSVCSASLAPAPGETPAGLPCAL